MQQWLGIAMVYLAAALVLTWPLAAHLTTRLGALHGLGDPFLNLWILGWGLQAWTSDPAGVVTGRVFDANIFFPAAGTLTYSDHFLLQALVLSPVYAVTGDAVLCYNLLLILSIAASGLAMHALARTLGASTSGALAAGLAWALWPYRTAHLLHIQLQALYFMPLALLFLHRLMAGRRWGDAAGLGLSAGLQAVASVYYGVMTAVVLVVATLALAVGSGQWRSRRLWSRVAVAAALGLLVTAPVLVVYARTQETEGFGRSLFEAANHSAAVASYLQVPHTNLVYGRTGWLAPRPPRADTPEREGVEHQMFPGAVLIALGVVALWRHWRSDARAVTRTAAALVVTGVGLSFGPEGVRGLYAAVHDHVPGFQAIRAPARFGVVAMLGLAVLASLALKDLGRRGVPIVLVALMTVEFLNAPLPLAAAPPLETPSGQWLRHEPGPGAVLYVPLTFDIENTPFMVHSLEHQRPIVNGYSGQRPVFYSAVVEGVADLPAPQALAMLHELDVRFVVSPSAMAGTGSPTSPFVERARFGERNQDPARASPRRERDTNTSEFPWSGGVIYELRWTPEALAALNAGEPPPPPSPGPAVFTPGERAVYDVYWDGGPLNVPAGRATLDVLRGPPDGDRWQFDARAESANWLSRFFEARDRFATSADTMLRPIEHVREIREGRRALDRTYLYDREAGIVRVGESRAGALAPDALTLPLGSVWSRDALTALYYVRTLALAPGAQVAVPLNDAGANVILQVAAGEVEIIDHGGSAVAALRLEPRVIRRLERRRPVRVTIWLSTDGRRVPLRAIVEAGFGRARAELVDYRR